MKACVFVEIIPSARALGMGWDGRMGCASFLSLREREKGVCRANETPAFCWTPLPRPARALGMGWLGMGWDGMGWRHRDYHHHRHHRHRQHHHHRRRRWCVDALCLAEIACGATDVHACMPAYVRTADRSWSWEFFNWFWFL
ncbi:unnamed protein product [Laminaria digitata]